MTALQLNHQTEFDGLWTFVKNHMWPSGNTIDWQVTTSGSVSGSGGAPDGDEWLAAALVFAHYRWGDTSGKYNYGTEAQKTLDLVRTTDFSSTYHLVRYYSGTDGNGTDASYMLPAFYQTWACFDTANADFWNTALTTTRSWLQTAAGSTGNIGDQSSFAGQTTNSGGDDKLRIVANFMSDYNFFDADPFETTYASEYATWVTQQQQRFDGHARVQWSAGLRPSGLDRQGLRAEALVGGHPDGRLPLLRRHALHDRAALRERRVPALVLSAPARRRLGVAPH